MEKMEKLLSELNATPTTPKLSISIALNKELIMQFFMYFARTEYALKRAGYTRGDERKVEADWDRFAANMQDKFDPSMSKELTSAVEFLFDNPPQKQVLKDGNLDWVDSGCGSNRDLSCLLVLVRRVRNNLFHGGKFPLRPVSDVSRNERLLQNSLLVLGAVLQLNPQVNQFFSEEIE
jgi:hypothetical protein